MVKMMKKIDKLNLMGLNEPSLTHRTIIDADFERFKTELGYGNRESILESDFNVLFDNEYGTWLGGSVWDTLFEATWGNAIWRNTFLEITIDKINVGTISHGIEVRNAKQTSSSGTRNVEIYINSITHTVISTSGRAATIGIPESTVYLDQVDLGLLNIGDVIRVRCRQTSFTDLRIYEKY